jgi:hypothetical protein
MTRAISPGEAKRKVRLKDVNIAKVRGKETNNMAAAAAVSPDKPLTDQQHLFVQYWAEGDSIPNAYSRAGYSINDISYAFRMKRMPNILRQYHLVKAEFIKAAQLSREDVMNGLKESIDMAKLMSEPATMIAGWREIGRLCGYYEAKKIDINVNVNGSIAMERMNKMSDADLLKIIEEASLTGVDQALIGEGPGDDDENP